MSFPPMQARPNTAPPSAAYRAPMMLTAPDGRRPKLLLAEDCDPVRIVTAAMLKGMGCDVDAVVHGEEAVQSARANQFDVIVLDIEMPVMDGITAARSIRRHRGVHCKTPIMALSALLADAMQSATWRDTFDIALPKPANRNELHAAVRTALSWRRDIEAERFAMLPEIVSDEACAKLRAGLAEPVWRELFAIACRDIADCVTEVTADDAGRILVGAQKLRALGRTFAAPRMASLAEQFELASGIEVRSRLLRQLEAAAGATIEALRKI